jgi:hypothetical protein
VNECAKSLVHLDGGKLTPALNPPGQHEHERRGHMLSEKFGREVSAEVFAHSIAFQRVCNQLGDHLLQVLVKDRASARTHARFAGSSMLVQVRKHGQAEPEDILAS